MKKYIILQNNLRKNTLATLVFVVVLISISVGYVSADTMTSGTYKIQSDSLNFAGTRGTSTTFVIEDTLGEVATGESGSTNFNLKAGYQQMHEVYLSVVPAGDVTMSPSIGGVTGGTSNGSTNFTVTTDDAAGYIVTLVASSSPALISSLDTIADYTRAGVNPDFTFSVANTDSEFAFTPEGTDIAQEYKDNGGSCNTGSSDTADACWSGLSTSPLTIVSRTSGNHPTGSVTTLKFKVKIGSQRVQIAGDYTATTTLTVLPL